MNYCTWKAPLVTLADGREVPSDHPDHRAECEARFVLGMHNPERVEFFDRATQRRGADAVASLKQTMAIVEPAYVLDLPNKPQRRAYLARLQFVSGQNAYDLLSKQILELHECRKAAEVDLQSAAA